MYQEDYFNSDENDFESENNVETMLEKEKMKDKGYNVIYRKSKRPNGRTYSKKIKIYTSSGTGNFIRDVETGKYFPNIVGSKDEDLFFKVILATGERQSANGFSTLFFISPQHYADYLQCEVDPIIAYNWEKKRDARLAELKTSKRSVRGFATVR
jgi:hypothetical protein